MRALAIRRNAVAHFLRDSFNLPATPMAVEIKSDVAGTVWKIEVQPGDQVSAGDVLVILESMKMEIPVIAHIAGTVAKLWVNEQEMVAEGQAVALIEA